MEGLPVEMLFLIFDRVGELSWPSCRFVCRAWNELLLARARRTFLPSERLCAGLAAQGRLAELQWVRAHGARWDEDTCTAAASNGHLDVLRWASANRCPLRNWLCTKGAVIGDQLQVLQWLYDDYGLPHDIIYIAADAARHAIFDWLLERLDLENNGLSEHLDLEHLDKYDFGTLKVYRMQQKLKVEGPTKKDYIKAILAYNEDKEA